MPPLRPVRSLVSLALLLALAPGLGGTTAEAAAGDAIVVGAGPGGAPHVRVFSAATLVERLSLFPYDLAFRGGVQVAAGDVTGDGVADVITAPGPGGGPHVKVLDGVTGAELASFFAFDPGFTGGVHVAAGDVNGDGYADIVTGAGAGGGPHVQVFDGRTLALLHSFFAFDPGLLNGVSVGTGDVTGDDRADIIAGAGPGGGPHVKVFDGVTGAEVLGFFAFDGGFRGGVHVAAGYVDDDGLADIVVGAGPGGAPEVRVFSGADGSLLASYLAYDAAFLGGVGVGVVAVTRTSSTAPPGAILTLAGPTGGSHGRVIDPATGADLASFSPFPGFTGGGSVAGSQVGKVITLTDTTRVYCRNADRCSGIVSFATCSECRGYLPDSIVFECDPESNCTFFATPPGVAACTGDCKARSARVTYDCQGGTCRAGEDTLSCERTASFCTSLPPQPVPACVPTATARTSIDRGAANNPFVPLAVVTICKITEGGNEDFPFSVDRDSLLSPSVDLGTLGNGGVVQHTVAIVDGPPQPVRLKETIPSGWTLTNVECSAPVTENLGEGSVTFSVVGDEHVTCTFVNTKGAVTDVRLFPDGLTGGEAANNTGSFGLPPGNRIAIAGAEGFYIVDALTDQIPTAGTALLKFTSFVPNTPLFGVLVLPDPLGGDADVLFTHGPTGTTQRPFDPPSGDFGFTQVTPAPGFNATDAVQFGGDPAAPGAVYVDFTHNAVLAHVPKDLGGGQLFYTSTSLAGASAFAGASGKAVTAFAWDLTFDPTAGTLAGSNQGRVAVVTDGQPGQLYLVDPATPLAAATLVGAVGNDPRRIRCLPAHGLCAVSNFGSDSLTIVLWNGRDTIAIAGSVTVGDGPVGIDLRADGANTAIVSTGFGDDTVTVTVRAPDGSPVSSVTDPVPAGCTGPGHAIWLRNTPTTAVVTCNGSSAYAVITP